jgi:hypothetical protein
MKNRLLAIALRREALLIKIEGQRMHVGGISLRWKTPLTVIDSGMQAVRFMHSLHAALASE